MNVDFITAIKLFFANYANFKGRSTRAEYWWAMLFMFLLNTVVSFLGSEILNTIVQLGLFIPSLSIFTRRLHDIGKSGWWVVGFVASLIVVMAVFFGAVIFSAVASGNVDAASMAASIKGSAGLLVVGFILILAIYIYSVILTVKPSGPDNKYGPNPYGNNA